MAILRRAGVKKGNEMENKGNMEEEGRKRKEHEP